MRIGLFLFFFRYTLLINNIQQKQQKKKVFHSEQDDPAKRRHFSSFIISKLSFQSSGTFIQIIIGFLGNSNTFHDGNFHKKENQKILYIHSFRISCSSLVGLERSFRLTIAILMNGWLPWKFEIVSHQSFGKAHNIKRHF